MTEHTLDARGLRCPWPALRLARVMRRIATGEGVRMLVDDPLAETEITALASTNGWSLREEEEEGSRAFIIFH